MKWGGGIEAQHGAPTITNSEISNNEGLNWAGGVYLDHSYAILNKLIIKDNEALYSGGIAVFGGSPTITYVEILDNEAFQSSGGGIGIEGVNNLVLSNLTVIGNHARWTGGIQVYKSTNIIIKNSFFKDNYAQLHTGAIQMVGNSTAALINLTIIENEGGSGVACYDGCEVNITNSIIRNNLSDQIRFYYDEPFTDAINTISITHSNIAGGLDEIETNLYFNNVNWLTDNIDSDPLFVDPANGDYRLQADSPCIDGGTNDTDGDGIADITDYFGSSKDMGMYEYEDTISIYGCMDASACNHDTMATDDDLSCEYAEQNYDCNGKCISDDFDGDNICDEEDIDDDNDGSPDYDDSDDNNEYICSDDDGDTCDDCSNGSYDLDSECQWDVSIELHAGANLISFYALPEDVSIEAMMEPLVGNITTVLSGGAGAQYLDEGGWIGSLRNISQDDGYWVWVTEATTLSLTDAEPVNYDADGIVIYDMHVGNNLISYPFDNDQGLEAGLGNAIADVYALVGEGVAALKIGNSFVGSLEAFEGGKGYWLVATADFVFTYNGTSDALVHQEPVRAVPEIYSYVQSVEQAFHLIESVSSLNAEGDSIDEDDIIIAYNGDVVVGSRYWNGEYTDIPAMGIASSMFGIDSEGGDMYAGYCEEGDEVSFKIWDDSAGLLLDMIADGDVEWNSMGISVINLCSSSPCALSNNSFLPLEYSLNSPYPNPFNPVTSIQYSIPVNTGVELIIYDITGRQIQTLVNDFQTAGYHSINWNALSYPSGVYILRMESRSFSQTRKVVLLK